MYLPRDIMIVITEFLGHNYWKHREDLTEICIALDFRTSNYSINSYWLWNEWRERNTKSGVSILKPRLPHRFDIEKLNNNKYIYSIDPPQGYSYRYLKNLHSQASSEVHFK